MIRVPTVLSIAAVMCVAAACGATRGGLEIDARVPDAAVDSAVADSTQWPIDVADDTASDVVEADTQVELKLLSVDPDHGPASGMTTVSLIGSGFVEGAQVLFGSEKALYLFVLSDQIVNCTAPPHGPGMVAVRIVLPDGREAVLDGAYTYESEVAVSLVFPDQGPSIGGTPVEVSGAGFQTGPTFLFGGRAAVGVQVVDDALALMVTPPHDAGTVSLIAVTGDGHASLPAAFEYLETPVQPGLPGLAVTGCSPGSGPAEGGAKVYISGTGFKQGMGVRIGALPATGVKVLGDTLARVMTPEGSPGPADVVVRLGNAQAVLSNGFEYEGDGPVVLAVEPGMGAWAGGTRVRIYGYDLDSAEHLFFGSHEVKDLEVVSSILITATTPRVEGVGYVPVTVFGKGASIAQSAFFFFDPSLKWGGTWGGPIFGAVNVTVMSLGKPLDDAYVILGHDTHTPWQGRTDDRGQITYSEFGMSGPVTVTATKEAFTAYTVADFDARNVTVYVGLLSTPEGTSPPPGSGSKSCLVRGRVLDYDKYFLKPSWVEGEVFVECGTSSSSLFGGTPDPGPGAVVDESGSFEIVTRTGQFSVLCRLMFHDPDLYKDVPLRMGATPHIKCPQPDTIEGVEVALTIETDAELWVAMDDVPSDPGGINGPNFMGGFRLGQDGYLDILKNVVHEPPERAAFRYQPRVFDGPLDGYGYSFYTTASSKTGNGMPYGVTLTTDVQPPRDWPILVGDDSGLVEVPTTLDRAVTDLLAVEGGVVLAADSGGGTYWYDGIEFYLAPVHTHRPIYSLFGSGLEDFWAVGAGGSVWRVQGKVADKVPTGINEDLTGISGVSNEDLHVVGGSFLLRWDGLSFNPENVPSGMKLETVRRFPEGGLVAVGMQGAVLRREAGGDLEPIDITGLTDNDLHGIGGVSLDDMWVAGDNGVLVHMTGDGHEVFEAPTDQNLRGVQIAGPCDLYLYGDEGTFFRFDCKEFTDMSRPDVRLDVLAGTLLNGTPVLAGRHYVELPPFIGFPAVKSPAEDETWSGADISVEFPPSQVISYHRAILSGPDGKSFWIMTINGEARQVPLPDLESVMGYTPVPQGFKRMNLTSVYSPGFDIDAYTSSNMNFYRREAYTVDLVSFE